MASVSAYSFLFSTVSVLRAHFQNSNSGIAKPRFGDQVRICICAPNWKISRVVKSRTVDEGRTLCACSIWRQRYFLNSTSIALSLPLPFLFCGAQRRQIGEPFLRFMNRGQQPNERLFRQLLLRAASSLPLGVCGLCRDCPVVLRTTIAVWRCVRVVAAVC